MKRYILLSVICCLGAYSFAQPKMELKEKMHDFGKVIEGEKPTHTFTFTNIGDEPIILTNVKPSCGCTTPAWPREPILPGKTGEIQATYNSQGRPGAFYKSITITSNVDEEPTIIKIKGVVVKKPAATYTAEQISNSPVMKLDKTEYYFGDVEVHKPNTYTFKVTNTGKSNLEITSLEAGCHCVQYKMEKESLKPGESGYLEVTYSAKMEGKNKDIVSIISNDIKTENPTITLKANAVKSLAAPSIMQKGNGFGF